MDAADRNRARARLNSTIDMVRILAVLGLFGAYMTSKGALAGLDPWPEAFAATITAVVAFALALRARTLRAWFA